MKKAFGLWSLLRMTTRRSLSQKERERHKGQSSKTKIKNDHCQDNYMHSLLKDLRHGIRGLLKRPGFTATAVLTLALGIGANTAIFSLMDSVMLRLLPVVHPEQIVQMRTLRPQGQINPNFSNP